MSEHLPEKINLAQKLALFSDRWSPRIVADLNGHQVKLAKLQGEFVWHSHQREEELFLVLHGTLTMRFRDHDVTLHEGEMIVVPAGVEHKPVAEQEVHILLCEPAATLNTGNVRNELTIENPQRI